MVRLNLIEHLAGKANMLYKLIPTVVLYLGLYFAVHTIYSIYSAGLSNSRLLMILLSFVLIVRGLWLLRSPAR